MKVKYFTLPNLFTLANLFCGLLATIAAVASIFISDTALLKVPLMMILCSAVFDFLDGLVARLTGQYSPLGVQLDSLADMVSFGAVPSLLLCSLWFHAGGEGWGCLVGLCVALCSALRLAKFNIDDSQTDTFEGLPTPALAIAIGSIAWAVAEGSMILSNIGIVLISLVGAWLLISPLRMFSLKFHGLSLKNRTNRLRYAFLLVSLIFIVVGGLGYAWCIIILYIFASLGEQIAQRRAARKQQ